MIRWRDGQSPGLRSRIRNPTAQNRGARFQRAGFAQHVIHARPQAFLPIAGCIVRAQCNNRHAADRPHALTDQLCGREAIHRRHAQIHQDQIETLAGGPRHRLCPVFDPNRRTAQCGQIALRHRGVDRFVLHQQHVPANGRLFGRQDLRRLHGRRHDTHRHRKRFIQRGAAHGFQDNGAGIHALAESLRFGLHRGGDENIRPQRLLRRVAARIDDHDGIAARIARRTVP